MNVLALQTLDSPMKKGVHWKPANALDLAYGGAGVHRKNA
jgi:hypothetical protein